MGFRLSKSIRLGGGTRLNLSSRGLGVSGGVKGFRVGIGPRGVRTTASLPGTGLSYSTTSSGRRVSRKNSGSSGLVSAIIVLILIGLAITYWPISLTLALIFGVAFCVNKSRANRQNELLHLQNLNEEQSRLNADASRAASIIQSFRSGQSLQPVASPTPLGASEICYQVIPAGLCLDHRSCLTNVDQGHLVLTNKRLIYLGTQKSVVTQIKNILAVSVSTNAGIEIRSQTRQRREVYTIAFPRELTCLLFCVFQQEGISPPVTIQTAIQMQNGFIGP